MDDGEFTLGRGTSIDGDADTETVFEVTPDYREGDAFLASQFAESFIDCARDVCREVVIDDGSDGPFTGWDLAPDKKNWGSLPCSFLTALADLVDPSAVGPWLRSPNPAFDGATPLQLFERGESDRLWHMIHELESGQPG